MMIKKIITTTFSFVAIAIAFYSCDTTEPDNGKINPPGYQEDIPWPSLADSPWPSFQNDPQNTGRSNLNGPLAGKIKWQKEFQFGHSPSFFTINHSGEIFLSYGSVQLDSASSISQYIISILESGEILWYKDLCGGNSTGYEESSAAVSSSKGVTYIASVCGSLLAINEDTSLAWKFDAGEPIYNGVDGINIDKLGNLYFSTISKFYSFNQDGSLRWTADKYNRQQAVLSADGNSIFIKANGSIDALDLNGNVKWSYPIDSGDYLLFLICDSENNIYFGINKSFYSIKANGELRWEYNLESNDDIAGDVSPTIDKNGNIFFCTENSLYSLNYSGELQWELENIDNGGSHLINDNNGNIFLADDRGGNLYSISNNGVINWILNLGHDSYMYCAMAIGKNSNLFVLAENPAIQKSTVFNIY